MSYKMNEDLKSHLTHDLTEEQDEFIDSLVCRLGAIALKGSFLRCTHVKFHPIEGEDDDVAYTEYDPHIRQYLAAIDDRLDFGSQCELICHELAHIHCWEETLHADDHCEVWGLSYSMMFREYLKECEEWCW